MKASAPKTKARKAARQKKSRWGEKFPKEKLEAFFAEVDRVFGDRDTGSTEFLIKLRRGEI
jgi:hypothetical protein